MTTLLKIEINDNGAENLLEVLQEYIDIPDNVDLFALRDEIETFIQESVEIKTATGAHVWPS